MADQEKVAEAKKHINTEDGEKGKILQDEDDCLDVYIEGAEEFYLVEKDGVDTSRRRKATIAPSGVPSHEEELVCYTASGDERIGWVVEKGGHSISQVDDRFTSAILSQAI